MTSRSSTPLLLGVGLAAVVGLGVTLIPPADPAHAGPADEAARAERLYLYRDDHEPERVLAQVPVRLEARGDRVELVLVPSAVGPLVDPIRELRGVRGGNHQTALDFERIHDGGRIEVVTRRHGVDDDGVAGTVELGGFGRLPERRLRADGSIDHRARGALRPLELAIGSGPVGEGRWTTQVLVDGRVRLTVEFAFADGRAELLDIHRGAPPARTETKL